MRIKKAMQCASSSPPSLEIASMCLDDRELLPSKRSGHLKSRIILDNLGENKWLIWQHHFDQTILGAGLVLHEHAQRLHGKLQLPGETIPMSFILVVEEFQHMMSTISRRHSFFFWGSMSKTQFDPMYAKTCEGKLCHLASAVDSREAQGWMHRNCGAAPRSIGACEVRFPGLRKHYCCEKEAKGCPKLRADGYQLRPVAVSDGSECCCCSGYDCNAGLANWERLWCTLFNTNVLHQAQNRSFWKRLKQVVKETFDWWQQRAKPNSGTLPVQRPGPRKTAINVTE